MIVTEFYGLGAGGVKLYRTYSDAGYKIACNDVVYDEAIDPEGADRVYIETDERRDTQAEDDREYIMAAKILLGEEGV